MPITALFTTNQVIGAPQNIVVNDVSTGTDVLAVNRRLYIVNALGQWVTESGVSDTITYTTWPLADGNSITLDILTSDAALNITLIYVDVSGNTRATSGVVLQGFTLYNESFYYTLSQDQALQSQPPPMIIQDSNYYMNKLILRTQIDSGNNAIEFGDDITTAQNAYDLATYMRINEGDYF